MVMKSLGDILKHQMKQTPVWKQVTATLVVEKVNEVITELFGQTANKYAQAIYFKNKVIAITCLSSVMAQEIKLNEQKIISTTNKKLGSLAVEKIKYLV